METLKFDEKLKPHYLRAVEDHGDFFIIRLQGDVNTHALEHGGKKMAALIEKNNVYSKPTLCDFEFVTDSDTATLAVLIKGFLEFRKHGGQKLVFFNIPGELRSLFEIAHLAEFFRVCESQDEAIAVVREM